MHGNGNGAWTGHLHGGGHPRAVQDVEPLLLGDVAVVVLVRLQEILPQLKVDHCNLQLTKVTISNLHYNLQLTLQVTISNFTRRQSQ